MRKTHRGSVLLEACIALPVAMLMILGTADHAAFFLWRSWVEADAFVLARAHLYGNQPQYCEPGRLARSLAWETWRLRYSCEGSGVVNYRIQRDSRRTLRGRLDLRRGSFRRRAE